MVPFLFVFLSQSGYAHGVEVRAIVTFKQRISSISIKKMSTFHRQNVLEVINDFAIQRFVVSPLNNMAWHGMGFQGEQPPFVESTQKKTPLADLNTESCNPNSPASCKRASPFALRAPTCPRLCSRSPARLGTPFAANRSRNCTGPPAFLYTALPRGCLGFSSPGGSNL